MCARVLEPKRRDLIDYQRARIAGRRISSAAAESVMNQLVNRRLSKRQQMRWSTKGAHCLLLRRVELLDGPLEQRTSLRISRTSGRPSCRLDEEDSPAFHPLQ